MRNRQIIITPEVLNTLLSCEEQLKELALNIVKHFAKQIGIKQ